MIVIVVTGASAEELGRNINEKLVCLEEKCTIIDVQYVTPAIHDYRSSKSDIFSAMIKYLPSKHPFGS